MTDEAAPLAAAQAVARTHGVACDEAVLIAAGSNVLVHLKPAPVVARVMTGTAVLHDDVEHWLTSEVAVGAFVAARGDLVVPPSDLLPPGPYEQDGLWMTLWKFVLHDPQAPPPEARELGSSLRQLHVVLADFPGDLAPLSEIRDWLMGLLAELRPSPDLTQPDIDWLGSKLDALTPAVFESSLPTQALHGDASMSNLLRTDSGLVWNDLEDVCAGPVAWDLAGLMANAKARGHSAAYVDELLASYGDPGVEDLTPFLEAHTLYEVIWHTYESRRRPEAMKQATASLARLREGDRRLTSSPRVAEHLTELELELLELCSMSPETTTTLHEEMLESPLDRRLVESALRGLVERGLMLTYRDVYSGVHRPRAGPPEDRAYEDDWWELTPAGRDAVKSA